MINFLTISLVSAQVALGWKPVPVPYFDFPDAQHKRVLYVREALAHFAGLALPLPCRPRSWTAKKEALVLADMRRLVRSQPDCGLPRAPVSAAAGLSAATEGPDDEDGAAATASVSRGTAALATPVCREAGPSAAADTQGPAEAGSSASGAVPVAPEAGSGAAVAAPGHVEAASSTAGAAAPAASQVRHVAAAGLQAAAQRAPPRLPLQKLPGKRASGQGGRFSLIAAAAVEAVRRRRRDEEAASEEEGARALEASASGSAGGKSSGA